MSSVYGQTLLDEMVRTQGLPMPLVKQAAREILEIIRGGLVRDGVVNVSNFGTFRLKAVAERNGFNPQTREPITIPAHQRVIFSPCKALRELIQPVHLPPIPIDTERAPRAAASAAAIAPAEPVATRTIIPPVESHEAANEQGRDETAPVESTTQERAAPLQTQSEVVQTTPTSMPQSQGSSFESATESNEVIELPLEDETFAALRQEKLQEGGIDKGGRKKYFLLSAAAIVVIAIVSASLMQRGEQSAPVALVAPKVTQLPDTQASQKATTQSSAKEATAAPVVKESPPASEMVSTETMPALQEASGITEGEDQQRGTAGAPAVVTPSPSTATPTATVETAATSEIAPERAEPVSVAETTRPSHFFFTEQQHLVANGESLWRLARRYYHDPLLWPHIYQANAAVIDDPDSLITGRNIVIPSLQGEPGKLTRTDRRNIAEGYYLTYLHYKNNGHKDAFFALLEAKRYDNKVVEEHRSLLKLSKVEEVLLGQQETMPF